MHQSVAVHAEHTLSRQLTRKRPTTAILTTRSRATAGVESGTSVVSIDETTFEKLLVASAGETASAAYLFPVDVWGSVGIRKARGQTCRS